MIPYNSELWRKFYQFVMASEGGKSNDSRDTWAVKCAPFAGAYHTNKGITFCTWKSNAKAIGSEPTYEAFLSMTDEQANKILYEFYLFSTKNGSIKDNAIALSITEAYWGSGGHAFQNLATALNAAGFKCTSALILTNQMIQGANSLDAKLLFDKFWTARYNYLKSLSNAPTYIKGWTTRINSFKKIFSQYAGTVGIIFFAVLAYYFYRIYSKV